MSQGKTCACVDDCVRACVRVMLNPVFAKKLITYQMPAHRSSRRSGRAGSSRRSRSRSRRRGRRGRRGSSTAGGKKRRAFRPKHALDTDGSVYLHLRMEHHRRRVQRDIHAEQLQVRVDVCCA